MKKLLTLFVLMFTLLAVSAQSCPDNNHPHMIDLGLPSGTKWACCNVGADKPEGYGDYYAWGETSEKDLYNDVTYQYVTGVDNDGDGWYDDYHSDTDLYGVWQSLGNDIAGSQDDVAHMKWGGFWTTPNLSQVQELIENCTYEFTSLNGVEGAQFKGSNGGTIFLPAAGYRKNDGLRHAGAYGDYWASTPIPSNPDNAYCLYFNTGDVGCKDFYRSNGRSVRPVSIANALSPLAVSMSSVGIVAGETITVEITSGNGYYTVSCSDSNVATTSLSGNTITITGVTPGTIVVTVTDTTAGSSQEINVTVSEILTCPDDNHPHLIDLGLPSGTKWACCNVGANTPEGYGGYYAWGETEEKTSYSWSTYIHCDGTENTCHYIGSNICGSEYDVAHMKWGGKWQMPSKAQFNELRDNCICEQTFVNGIIGYKLTSIINNKSIFLPAAGNYIESRLNKTDDYVFTDNWSGTLSYYNYIGYSFIINENTPWICLDSERCYGLTVRPVWIGDSYSLKGDVNGDGDVSVTDVAMIVNHILGVNDSNFIIANADINGDSEIDINDVMATVSIILQGNSGDIGRNTLVLWHADGTTTDVQLKLMPKVELKDDKVIITSSVLNMEYPKNDILRFTYKGNGTNVVVPPTAHNVGEAFYIYRNDGGFNAFFREEVDSITYSNYDNDSIWYNDVVTQVIYTLDSIYHIPLAAIDSVGFVQPETKYLSNVIRMEPMLPYIINVDGLTVTFSSSMPSNLMPRVGDVLLQDNFDSDKLPDGFAGKVVECQGLQIVCDSVSFEDIYEQIVCYGSYTAVNDEEKKKMRLVPCRIGGYVSTSIDINGTLGSMGTGIFASANGKLGLDLRVTFNFGVGKPIYFDLSLSPQLSLTIQSGVKGKFSDNVLSNKVNLFAVPIPDTPFLLKLKAGPVLEYSGDASVTATTQTKLGYHFDVKYEDGKFTGYGRNTSKWFSTPDIEGHVSGSIFAGVQTEFGIFSYGDLLSLSLAKEAGAEFVANLTEDLLNTDKYEELQKGKLDLNLKASVGVSAKAKFHKWINVSHNRNILSGSININTWKLVPTFQKPTVTVNNFSTATATVIPTEELLYPVSIGLGVWDKDEVLNDAQYCSKSYRVVEDWGLTQYQTTFSGLKPNQSYTVKPLVKTLGLEITASPSESFKTKELPVKITNFEQTGSQYKENGFTYDNTTYSYKYDVAVTVELESSESVEDWGYVYRDPNGRIAHISLKNYGSPYTDERYVYYRNKSIDIVTLYEYVKYWSERDTLYGEPKDYDVQHSHTYCPDDNHPHLIDLGLPSGTKWACCNVSTKYPKNQSPTSNGGYFAWGETEEKDYYNWITYQYCDKIGNMYFNCQDLGSDIAGTQYDVAHVQWGGSWVMPSLTQIQELLNNCSNQKYYYYWQFTGPNGSTIILPLAGYRWNNYLEGDNIEGYYWSSTQPQPPVDSGNAYDLNFRRGYPDFDYIARSGGHSVRPVSK